MVNYMANIVKFVKKYLPKIQEAGINIENDEFSIISGMKDFQDQGLFSSDNEKYLLENLFIFINSPDAFEMDFEWMDPDGEGYRFFIEHYLKDYFKVDAYFDDIKTYVSPEDKESGYGTCEISFKCNGKPYSFSAKFDNDWFDPQFLHFLNTVFEDQKMGKRLIAFGGRNCYEVTYQTPKWVERFGALLPLDIEII